MTQIQASISDRFVETDHPEYHAILVYGPDEGRGRERVQTLIKAVAGALDDPFLVSRLNAQQKTDRIGRNNNDAGTASLLIDQALQLSLTGCRRIVLCEEANDSHVAQVKALLRERLPLPALVILLAGDLTPRSKLRLLFGKEKTLASLPTYNDDHRSLKSTIRDWSRQTGYLLSSEAEAFLLQGLGSDRALTRQELEKLDLYMLGVSKEKKIELADLKEIIIDLPALDIDKALFAALSGQTGRALHELAQTLEQVKSIEMVVSVYLYHLMRLIEGQGLMREGKNASEAAEAMRPPVFFQKKAAFIQQLKIYSEHSGKFTKIYLKSLELQKKIRQKPQHSGLLVERFLMLVAQQASKIN